MKNFKLKKLLTLMSVTLLTAVVILPIKASAAWKQSDNGNWGYTEGNTLVSGWKSIDGNWYFFDSNAVMKTGWVLDGSSWYYAGPSGDMKTGWVNDGGHWYYTAPSGAMQTGWLSNNGSWYYLSTSGDMKTGLVEVNNKTYYLSESGAMKTGNITVNGQTYTFAISGEKINATNLATPQSSNLANGTQAAGGGSGSSNSSRSSSTSSSSSSTTNVTGTTYKDLYGNWVVEKHIDSNIPTQLDNTLINLAIGEKFNIQSDKIISSIKTISNPKVTEKVLTASDFYNKYSDTLQNVGISGNTVKFITVSQSDKPTNSVDVIVSNDGHVYSVVKGALFELERQ